MFDILDWNVDPNQRWYVKLADIGSQMRVELFNTQADAQGAVNRVANADIAFGVSAKALLTLDAVQPAYGTPLVKFNISLDYHLIAAGLDGDASKIFAIGPFNDLASIEDPLMLTEAMIQARATLEINRGTHSRLFRSLSLDAHYPALNEGDIITYSSTKRGIVAVRNRIESVIIQASIDDQRVFEFSDAIDVIEFKDFVRQ